MLKAQKSPKSLFPSARDIRQRICMWTRSQEWYTSIVNLLTCYRLEISLSIHYNFTVENTIACSRFASLDERTR